MASGNATLGLSVGDVASGSSVGLTLNFPASGVLTRITEAQSGVTPVTYECAINTTNLTDTNLQLLLIRASGLTGTETAQFQFKDSGGTVRQTITLALPASGDTTTPAGEATPYLWYYPGPNAVGFPANPFDVASTFYDITTVVVTLSAAGANCSFQIFAFQAS